MIRSLLILASRVVKEVPLSFSEQYNEARRQDHIQHVYEVIPFDQNEQMYEIAKVATVSEFKQFLDTHPYACDRRRLLKGIVEGNNVALFEYVMLNIFNIDLTVKYSIDNTPWLYLRHFQGSHIIWQRYILPHLDIRGIEYKMYHDVNPNICTYICRVRTTLYSDNKLDVCNEGRLDDHILSSGSFELFKDIYIDGTGGDKRLVNDNGSSYWIQTFNDKDIGYATAGGHPQIIDYVHNIIISEHRCLSREASVNLLCGAALSNNSELFRKCWDTFADSTLKYLGHADDPNFAHLKMKDLKQVNIALSVSHRTYTRAEDRIFNTLCCRGICNIIDEMLKINPNRAIDEEAIIEQTSLDMFRWVINFNDQNDEDHFDMTQRRGHHWNSMKFVENILILNEITEKTCDNIVLNPLIDFHIIELLRRYPRLVSSGVTIEEDYDAIVNESYFMKKFLRCGNVEAFSKYYKDVARMSALAEQPAHDEYGEEIEKVVTQDDIDLVIGDFLITALDNHALDIVEYILENKLANIGEGFSYIYDDVLIMRTLNKYLM